MLNHRSKWFWTKSEVKDWLSNKDSCLESYFILSYILKEWNNVEMLHELEINMLAFIIDSKV